MPSCVEQTNPHPQLSCPLCVINLWNLLPCRSRSHALSLSHSHACDGPPLYVVINRPTTRGSVETLLGDLRCSLMFVVVLAVCSACTPLYVGKQIRSILPSGISSFYCHPSGHLTPVWRKKPPWPISAESPNFPPLFSSVPLPLVFLMVFYKSSPLASRTWPRGARWGGERV